MNLINLGIAPSIPWSAILKRYRKEVAENGDRFGILTAIVEGGFGIQITQLTNDEGYLKNYGFDGLLPKDHPLIKKRKIGEVVEHNGKSLVVIYSDNKEIHLVPAEAIDLSK